jgi:hypothetical protein
MGSRLSGRYELRRRLGTDTQATRWEGFDLGLERAVLIRVLRPDLARQPDEVQRFWAEAGAAARGAVAAGRRVLDAGYADEDQLPFVVLELPGEGEGHTATAEGCGPVFRDGKALPPRQPRLAATPRQARMPRGVALALLLVPVVAGVVLIRGLLGGSVFQPSKVAAVLPTPVAVQATAQATVTPRAQVQPTPRPPTATPAPEQAVRRKIVNTDGQGVALRASPGGPRLPGHGYDEGAIVTVLGVEGAWAHIRGDDGRQGWILAVTLS